MIGVHTASGRSMVWRGRGRILASAIGRRGGGWSPIAFVWAFAVLLFPSAASAAVVTFDYNGTNGADGSVQSWTVPAGVTSATFDLYGAAGGAGAGRSFGPHAPGGRGAHLHAVLPVAPGQILQIFVGGAAPGLGSQAGGFNGGGGDDLVHGNTADVAGGGGGATDLRSGPTLGERLLVAGGGGGGGGNGNEGSAGGAGGASATIGSPGTNDANTTGGGPGEPGGASAGGAGGGAGNPDGTAGLMGALGEGGDVQSVHGGEGGDGGGGGGGLYGGGAGGSGGSDFLFSRGGGGGGGGGGSSFAAAAATGVTVTDGARAGHGQVVITFDPPPDTAITGGPDGSTNDSTPTFAFSADEPGSSFECSLDQGTPAFGPCSGPGATHTPGSALADGTYTFRVRAKDAAGNVDPTPASRTFTVDATPPDTEITAGPSGQFEPGVGDLRNQPGPLTNDSTPTFTFTSTEEGSSFECRIDDGDWADCSSPFTAPFLSDGQHTFAVRATDPAGNTDPTPASRTFTVTPRCTLVGVVVPIGGSPVTVCLLEERAASARAGAR